MFKRKVYENNCGYCMAERDNPRELRDKGVYGPMEGR